MIRKIEFQNKVGIDTIGVPEKNQITDTNINEIKSVVNNNADVLKGIDEDIGDFIDAANDRIGDVEDEIVNIDSDINSIENNIDNIEENTYTKTESNALLNEKATVTSLNNEISAREGADNNLQSQIDAIVASSDVVDIVGTYQELQAYDTSKLGKNDIIKVLDDSTHSNATSYYRWNSTTWVYIGSEGPYYTKSETDTLLNGKVNVEAGKGLSANDFTNAFKTKLEGIEAGAQVNKIETIKVNGTTKQISNKAVDITVPTKT